MNDIQLRNPASILVHSLPSSKEYETWIVPKHASSTWEHILFTPNSDTTLPESSNPDKLRPWEKELLRQSRQTQEVLQTLLSTSEADAG